MSVIDPDEYDIGSDFVAKKHFMVLMSSIDRARVRRGETPIFDTLDTSTEGLWNEELLRQVTRKPFFLSENRPPLPWYRRLAWRLSLPWRFRLFGLELHIGRRGDFEE